MKKKEEIVGIISAAKSLANFSKKNKRAPQPPTQYWKALVKVWFDLYAELIILPNKKEKAVPCFDTVESFQMKIIVREIKKRCEEKNIEWIEKNAIKYFEIFLRRAWEDDFTSKNFMLKTISYNKTKIFNHQITPKNDGGKNNTGRVRSTPVITTKPKGGFGKL